MVEDENGEPVSGLRREEFQILADGEPQQSELLAESPALTAVVLVDISASMASIANAGLPSSAHGSAGITEAVEEFTLKGVVPNDRLRVGAIGRRLFLSEQFTSNEELWRKEWHELFRLPPVEWLGPSRLWDALSSVIELMAPEPGQRAILLLSDGRATGNEASLRDVIDQAASVGISVNVSIHGEPPQVGSVRRFPDPTEGLRTLADETGGVYFWTNLSSPETYSMDRTKGFQRILDRLHRSYTLTFTPTQHDGRTHTLDVRVKRTKVAVKVRRMYIA
jgi:VWFA-related protein